MKVPIKTSLVRMAPKRRGPTPSERAAQHAQKTKEALARLEQRAIPGPGAYDPKAAPPPAHTGSTAFKSATDRAKRSASTAVPNAVGDPGAYEVTNHLSVSQFNAPTSSKKGAAGFGGTSKRELKLGNARPAAPGADDDATPGAGAYEPQCTENGREHGMSVQNGAEKMKSAAFASTTKRGRVVIASDGPGPAAYSPSFEAVETRVAGKVSTIGRDSKYPADHIDGTGDDCTTGASVGPGSYSPQRTKAGESDTIAHRADLLGVAPSASVASDSLRTGSVKAGGLW